MELNTQLNASDRSTRETISKNFQTIQSEDANDDGAFAKYQEETNDRLDKLEGSSATHDEVKQQIYELQKRINHLYAGDPQTIKAVVTEILEDKGVI